MDEYCRPARCGSRRTDRSRRCSAMVTGNGGANAGAIVTAVDRSEPRMARLRDNLARLHLQAETVVAAAEEWQAGPFDAVLVDAPCPSKGTIRRHPDIPWRRTAGDIEAL